jgi:S1-C subfamily serine protease
MKRASLLFLIMGLLLLAACGAPATAPTATPETTPIEITEKINGGLSQYEEALEDIYTRVSPSVVNIQVRTDIELFGDIQQEGAGSGFVWDTAGHIVTNAHVVDNASDVMVTFHDDVQVPAVVVASDPDSDLAVVRVDMPEEELIPVEIADFDEVAVGHVAIAIGNPYGLRSTMTTGIVSGLGRLLPSRAAPGESGTYSIPDVIQTDAALNPGNSGGVLVNLRGQVIGVPSAIITGQLGAVGLGFAIPAPIVEQVVPALIADGYYEYSWIGVSVTTLSAELARAMELDSDQRGALVVTVQENSPAEIAGLRASERVAEIYGREMLVGGDVIIAADGQRVKNTDDLITYQVRYTRPGQTLELTLLRDGQEITVEMVLGTRP